MKEYTIDNINEFFENLMNKPNAKFNMLRVYGAYERECEKNKKKREIENKYDMKSLHTAMKNYVDKTGRRITIEYLLIKGLNDTIQSAKELAEYLHDIKCNINLIPYNPTADNDYQRPSNNSIMKFKYLLEHSGKKVTVRLERGADIDAACGQLKGKVS